MRKESAPNLTEELEGWVFRQEIYADEEALMKVPALIVRKRPSTAQVREVTKRLQTSEKSHFSAVKNGRDVRMEGASRRARK